MKILVNILILIRITSGMLYDGKYFDMKDRIRAECIIKKAMSDYKYLGNNDKSVNGEPCVPWIEVTESWLPTASDSQKMKKQASESFHHSKCRNIKLSVVNPMYSVSTPSAIETGIPSGIHGPWCFIDKVGTNGTESFKYTPVTCFNYCDETKVATDNEKMRLTENGYAILKQNYNPALLDPIEKLFTEYQFGNMKYYTFKKSREQPPQYLELRQKVFIALCLVFCVVIAWILSCYFLKKHSQKLHQKKQKALEGFYESNNLADIKLQADLRREREEA